jgi:hypothetical protein
VSGTAPVDAKQKSVELHLAPDLHAPWIHNGMLSIRVSALGGAVFVASLRENKTGVPPPSLELVSCNP